MQVVVFPLSSMNCHCHMTAYLTKQDLLFCQFHIKEPPAPEVRQIPKMPGRDWHPMYEGWSFKCYLRSSTMLHSLKGVAFTSTLLVTDCGLLNADLMYKISKGHWVYLLAQATLPGWVSRSPTGSCWNGHLWALIGTEVTRPGLVMWITLIMWWRPV